MQNNLVDETILAVIGTLVSVTVFATGFMSVIVHADRARALERNSRVRHEIESALAEKQEVKDFWLRSEYDALTPASRPFPLLVGVVNGLVFLGVFILAMMASNQGGSRFALVAIVITEFVVVVIGVSDLAAVGADVRRRQTATAWHRCLEIEDAITSRSGLPGALTSSRVLIAELPESPLVYRRRGELLVAVGDYEEAKPAFETTLDLVSGDPVAGLGLARVESESGSDQAAQELLLAAAREFPHDEDARFVRLAPRSVPLLAEVTRLAKLEGDWRAASRLLSCLIALSDSSSTASQSAISLLRGVVALMYNKGARLDASVAIDDWIAQVETGSHLASELDDLRNQHGSLENI